MPGIATSAVEVTNISRHGSWVLLDDIAAPLQAGGADQDFDFDQFDLIQVQVSAKYLTGQSATWDQGDWNGAPGGSVGNPE